MSCSYSCSVRSTRAGVVWALSLAACVALEACSSKSNTHGSAKSHDAGSKNLDAGSPRSDAGKASSGTSGAGGSGTGAGDSGARSLEAPCPGAKLVTDQIVGHAQNVSLDNDNFYWFETGIDKPAPGEAGRARVMKVSIDGGDPVELFSNSEAHGPWSGIWRMSDVKFDLSGKYIYAFAPHAADDNQSCDDVWAVARDGSGATAGIWTRKDCSDNDPFALSNSNAIWITDGVHIFFNGVTNASPSQWGDDWADTIGIYSIGVDGTGLKLLMPYGGPSYSVGIGGAYATIADGNLFFYENGNQISVVPLDGLSVGTLPTRLLMAPAGQQLSDVSPVNNEGDTFRSQLVVEGGYVYYRGSANSDKIFKVPTSGGPTVPTLLVDSDQTHASNYYMAIRDSKLYFVTRRDGEDCHGAPRGRDACHYLAEIATDGSDNGVPTMVGGAWRGVGQDSVFVNDSGLFVFETGDNALSDPDKIYRCP